jgi:hypothetical protein
MECGGLTLDLVTVVREHEGGIKQQASSAKGNSSSENGSKYPDLSLTADQN